MKEPLIPKPILDRRRCVRIAENLPFKIGHHGYELEAVTVNIGLHGIMCLVNRDIPMMTQLNLCLSLPAQAPSARLGRKIRLKGVVVRKDRCEEPGKFYLAVFFSEIKPADLKILQRYIQSHVKGSDI